MSIETDTRDRVIRLESKIENLTDRFDTAQERIDEMYELLTRARGIGWFWITGLAFAGAAGSGVTWVIHKLFNSLHG